MKFRSLFRSSVVALSRGVKFLGMTIIAGTIAISAKFMQRAMDRVKELTPRGTSLSIEQTVQKINSWYVGWAAYHSMTQYPAQLKTIETHLRRRLRARIVSQQKRRRHLVERLVKEGIPRKAAMDTAYSNRSRWWLFHSAAVEKAFPNSWFIHTLAQEIASDHELPHWFSLKAWIKVT